MLTECCKKYYQKEYDLNCCECILCSANEEYKLGLDKDSIKLAGGFGGGMGTGSTCGVVIGSIMAIGNMYVEERAHKSPKVKEISKEFIDKFTNIMGTLNCTELKKMYANEEVRCSYIINTAAEVLEGLIVESE